MRQMSRLKCNLNAVQDEKHVLFLCPCMETSGFNSRLLLKKEICRAMYWFTVADKNCIWGTGAFYFDIINAENVTLFLLK